MASTLKHWEEFAKNIQEMPDKTEFDVDIPEDEDDGRYDDEDLKSVLSAADYLSSTFLFLPRPPNETVSLELGLTPEPGALTFLDAQLSPIRVSEAYNVALNEEDGENALSEFRDTDPDVEEIAYMGFRVNGSCRHLGQLWYVANKVSKGKRFYLVVRGNIIDKYDGPLYDHNDKPQRKLPVF